MNEGYNSVRKHSRIMEHGLWKASIPPRQSVGIPHSSIHRHGEEMGMLQSLSTHKLLPDREDKDNLEVLRKQNRRNTREVSMLPLSARNATEVSTLAFECKKCKRGEHASL